MRQLHVRDIQQRLLDIYCDQFIEKYGFDLNPIELNRPREMRQKIIDQFKWHDFRWWILVVSSVAVNVLYKVLTFLGSLISDYIHHYVNREIKNKILRTKLMKMIRGWSFPLDRDGDFVRTAIEPGGCRYLKLDLIRYLESVDEITKLCREHCVDLEVIEDNLDEKPVISQLPTRMAARVPKMEGKGLLSKSGSLNISKEPQEDHPDTDVPENTDASMIKNGPKTTEENDDIDKIIQELDLKTNKTCDERITPERKRKRKDPSAILKTNTRAIFMSKSGTCVATTDGDNIILNIKVKGTRLTKHHSHDIVLTDNVEVQRTDIVQTIVSDLNAEINTRDKNRAKDAWTARINFSKEYGIDFNRKPTRLVMNAITTPFLKKGETLSPTIRLLTTNGQGKIAFRKVKIALQPNRMQSYKTKIKNIEGDLIVAFSCRIKGIDGLDMSTLYNAIIFQNQDDLQPIAYVHNVLYKHIADRYELICYALQNTKAVDQSFE